MEINARNVNDALCQALYAITDPIRATKETSRNGPVLVFNEPVLTTYSAPRERVLFCPVRNANPFFHLMESLWMLAGHNDLAFPVQFNSRFKEYSDDGRTLLGAYGYRWRKYFGSDQLAQATAELKRDPTTRRVVVSMWSPNDLGGTGKDLPCNTHIYFDLRGGALNMTVCNRSNDILWGAYGANAVHFSILQEYMAASVQAPVGVYRQLSNNLHLYTDILPEHKIQDMIDSLMRIEGYDAGIEPATLVNTNTATWDKDLKEFMRAPLSEHVEYKDPFFTHVAVPMFFAWHHRKDFRLSMWWAKQIAADDWGAACVDWLDRAEVKRSKV